MEVQSEGNLSQEGLEGATIQLESVREDSIELARRTLVGKILWEKPLNKGAIKQMLFKAWGDDAEEMRVTKIGSNVYMFNFQSKKKARGVFEKGPWNVMGHLLSMQYWIHEASVYEINFDVVAFWVQLHGMPLECMTIKNSAKIASLMGEVLEVENLRVEGTLMRTLMRVKVGINVKKPLPTGFWVPRANLPKAWVLVKYEKLQDFCYSCGVIGHDQKSCKEERAMASYNSQRPRYGPQLGVPPAKSLASIILSASVQNSEKTQQTNPGGSPSIRLEGSNEGPINKAQESVKGYKGKEQCVGDVVEPAVEPTVVDLNSGLRRPGLGPENMGLLQMEKEFISLYQPCVCLDYGSLERRYDSANLTPIDISKCKEAWIRMEWGRETNKNGMTKGSDSEGQVKNKATGEGIEYFVEFPSDEDEAEPTKRTPLENEKQLIHGFNLALSLKRGRSPEDRGQLLSFGKTGLSFLKRGKFEVNVNSLKGEEAAQSMPPKGL
ncbi:Zinc finger, CCHC-type [Sesbania bispinosa]|nr:Zinc finger, CCHC-type [Sesbania bispinosa]